MNIAKETMNQLLKKTTNYMIDKDEDEWPPTCNFIIYQPVRPARSTNDCTETNGNTEENERI